MLLIDGNLSGGNGAGDEEEEEDLIVVDEDFEFNEDRHNEEYVKVQHNYQHQFNNKDSYSIIPFSGV
jgi:hypothetical protein